MSIYGSRGFQLTVLDFESNIDPIFGENFGSARSSDEFRRGSLIPAANAAAALAQLHNHRPEYGWDTEQVC